MDMYIDPNLNLLRIRVLEVPFVSPSFCPSIRHSSLVRYTMNAWTDQETLYVFQFNLTSRS